MELCNCLIVRLCAVVRRGASCWFDNQTTNDILTQWIFYEVGIKVWLYFQWSLSFKSCYWYEVGNYVSNLAFLFFTLFLVYSHSIKSGGWFKIILQSYHYRNRFIPTVGFPKQERGQLCLESEPCVPFQYRIRYLIVRSSKASKPQDLYLELHNRFEIWLIPGLSGPRCGWLPDQYWGATYQGTSLSCLVRAFAFRRQH